MVRIAFLLFFVLSWVEATQLNEKISSFIGEKEYKVQKNLIRILFKDENKFLYDDSSVDDIKVLEKLKESGLLKLFYKNPQTLNLSFFTKDNALIFMRVINETLSSMGYNYFLTNRALKNVDGFVWEIIISTEHIVDPIIFSNKLKLRGCFLESIDRTNENEWKYIVNTENIKIEAIKIEANTTVKLKKPIKPYWIDIEDMKTISFVSKIADKWHPNIVFFDEKLHIVSDYRKDEVTNKLKLRIPINSRYVKIADMYTLDNIKRGITIYLRSKN